MRLKIRKFKRTVSPRLHQQAFDHSLLPNIITRTSDGKIIEANNSASKLLGYSKRLLLTKNIRDIFTSVGNGLKHMLKARRKAGHASGDLTIIKKDGTELDCQFTSAEFTGENDIQKAITTLVDSSESTRRQENIDIKNEERQAVETSIMQSRADATQIRLDDLEYKLDKERTENEEFHSSTVLQKIVLETQLEEEIRLKEIQITDAIAEAKELERSGIGKELHDNVNQLLAASRLYLDMARKQKLNREQYFTKASEYTLTAIEEIRKLTKRWVNDELLSLGLCDAIQNSIVDLMEVYPVAITCNLDKEIQARISAKLSLNLFRIVQELLNNIIKHAQASAIKIVLFQDSNTIILIISDNGLGFDINKKREGIGIANIKSRSDSYNGKTEFISEPGKGCKVIVTFPFESSHTNNL